MLQVFVFGRVAQHMENSPKFSSSCSPNLALTSVPGNQFRMSIDVCQLELLKSIIMTWTKYHQFSSSLLPNQLILVTYQHEASCMYFALRLGPQFLRWLGLSNLTNVLHKLESRYARPFVVGIDPVTEDILDLSVGL